MFVASDEEKSHSVVDFTAVEGYTCRLLFSYMFLFYLVSFFIVGLKEIDIVFLIMFGLEYARLRW